MKKKSKTKIIVGVGLLAAFALWTCLLRVVDVQAIGPQGSSVGFATLNRYVHTQIGVRMSLYTLTDWLGLVPIVVALGFGVFGLLQWIRRKSLCRVDGNILLLGGFYVAVMALYVLFEAVAVNYRPVLINGFLETSYPSSTTLLVSCVMPTAALQLYSRIKHRTVRLSVVLAIAVFVAFMVIGRLLSGVHWVSDVIGGALLSAGLVLVYDGMSDR